MTAERCGRCPLLLLHLRRMATSWPPPMSPTLGRDSGPSGTHTLRIGP